MDDIEQLYRLYFNLAVYSVTKDALKNGYTKEMVLDELEKEVHTLANKIPVQESERFIRIMQEEAINFTQQLMNKEEYKDVDQIMEEIGW